MFTDPWEFSGFVNRGDGIDRSPRALSSDKES
jgi:hypothetical protein